MLIRPWILVAYISSAVSMPQAHALAMATESNNVQTSDTFLNLEHGDRIAFQSLEGSHPGVVVCNGFRSEMNGRKAMALQDACGTAGQAFVRFDYRGHGQSSLSSPRGLADDFTLSDWIQDTLAVLDEVTTGSQILVGSSMGAWIAIHVALARPERVAGIVGIGAGPDFTQDLWHAFTEQERQSLIEGHVHYQPTMYSNRPFPITRHLIEDGRQWLLLDKPTIPVKCPIHLIHGQNDVDVPWDRSMRLADLVESANVAVTLVKNGDHRLSGRDDLDRIVSIVDHMTKLVRCTAALE